MKKEILFYMIFLFLVANLITNVSALASNPPIPTSISLKCGEVYNEHFVLSGAGNITLTPGVISSPSINYFMGLTLTSADWLYISLFPTGDCNPGNSTFSFDIQDETYEIMVGVTEDLWNLFGDDEEQIIFENERLNIGSDIGMTVIEIGDGVAKYKLDGCGSGNTREIMDVGESKEYECGEEKVLINLIRTFPSINAASFSVYASENWITSIIESNETYYDDSKCVLGIDTLGAKVKRGNIFAINTINANSGKYVPNVIVRILDQAGELPPISGQSDNTGFFSQRLHEDYKQNLVVKLEKEGCEPTNKVIIFEKSYDDYKAEKQQQQEAYQLILNMSGRFQINTPISNTVKNALNEGIGDSTVRITKPDGSSLDITTDANGGFSVTPDQIGIWKFQASKDEYVPSEVSEVEVYQLKEYLIKIKVNGKIPDSSEYNEGDMITFELWENNTIVPLTVDGTFAEQPIHFIDGVSDPVEITKTSTLSIPAIGNYKGTDITLQIKKFNWKMLWWIVGIIIAVLVLMIIIIIIIRKFRGGRMVGKSKIPKALRDIDINLG